MSVLDVQSFDVLTPAQHASTGKLLVVGDGIVSTTGRTGNGIKGTAAASDAQNSVTSRVFSPTTPAEGYQGVCVKPIAALPAAEQKIWTLRDTSGADMLTATLLTDGKLKAYRGTTAGTVLGTTASAFVAAAANRYLEFGWKLTGTGAALEVRSTASAASPIAATFAIATPFSLSWAQYVLTATSDLMLDDVYLVDAKFGSSPRYFCGDTAISILYPIGVTYEAGYELWVPNSGSDKIAPVDDTAMDDDSTYLRTRQAYSWIDFQMTALTDDGRTVSDVQLVAIARAVSSGFNPGMELHMWRWDGITLYPAKTPSGNVTQTGYTAFTGLTQGPGSLGGDTWTIARINASRFGVRS